MLDPILNFVSDNMIPMNAVAAFICGACLMYLVVARTLKKRRQEELDLAETS